MLERYDVLQKHLKYKTFLQIEKLLHINIPNMFLPGEV